jgi:hypothetical protein
MTHLQNNQYQWHYSLLLCRSKKLFYSTHFKTAGSAHTSREEKRGNKDGWNQLQYNWLPYYLPESPYICCSPATNPRTNNAKRIVVAIISLYLIWFPPSSKCTLYQHQLCTKLSRGYHGSANLVMTYFSPTIQSMLSVRLLDVPRPTRDGWNQLVASCTCITDSFWSLYSYKLLIIAL